MIFSKNIYKLVSGKNVSVFQSEPNKLEIFVFNKSNEKYVASFSSNSISIQKVKDFSYNKVIKLSSEHGALCYDKSISIVDNKNYDI